MRCLTNRIVRSGWVALLSALITAPSAAQVLAPVAPTGRSAQTTGVSTDSLPHPARAAAMTPADIRRGFVGGVLGSVAGAIAGAAAGSLLARKSGCVGEYCGLFALAGGTLGEPVGLAVGAHLGSGGRASMALTTLVSTAIAVTGSILAGASGAPITLALVPAIQLFAVMSLERDR